MKKKYWYRIYVGECPICGRDKSYRERVYGEKPKDTKNRYVWLKEQDTYDNCDIYY